MIERYPGAPSREYLNFFNLAATPTPFALPILHLATIEQVTSQHE